MEHQHQNRNTTENKESKSHLSELKKEIRQFKKLDLNAHKIQERLNLITQVAVIGVWEWDLKLDKFEWDDKMYEIYGILPRQFMTHASWLRKIHPDDLPAFEKSIKITLETENQDYFEFRIVRSDGSIRHLNTAAGVIRDKDNTALRIVGVNKDITERKMAEAALKKSEQELRFSNATKDKLFSILAHDLVSPFTSVLGFSKLLMHSSEERDFEKVEEYSTSINVAANQTFHLLTNLLEWARSQRDKIQFNPETIHLKEIINQVNLLYCHALDEKEIYLEIDIKSNFTLEADSNMLLTIIRNLVSNAIKYTEEEGIIKITAWQNEKQTDICVADTGKGISENNLEQILDFGLNFTTKGSNSESGTGLGLIICKDFVERHGGKIWIKSKENIGTKVCFSIPNKQLVSNFQSD